MDPVDVQAVHKTCFFRVFFQSISAQLFGELSEIDIAGYFECFFQIHCSMGRQVCNLVSVAVVFLSTALYLEGIGVIQCLDGSCCCYQLENRSRREFGTGEPVDVYAGFVIGRNRRWILRIICRRADHADDLSGLIIVDSDRTLSPIKCPVCFCADIGVQRHSDVFSGIV